MSEPTDQPAQAREGKLYGAFAYGTVALTCYATFLPKQYYFHDAAWLVPVVFALGAAYVALGVLCGIHAEYRGWIPASAYYGLQCTILTAILVLSPVRGFVGILVLPLVSQGIFDLRPRYAALVGVYLFGINVAIYAVPYGLRGASEAMLNYATAFAFTGVFTVITRRALTGRQVALKLRNEVEAANRQLRENAAQAEELATTRERNRVAREIHDGVGHY
ncbi:MAG TPA: hypothetical protein VG710_18870, partial [Opitutus sp.]|nr:hypothetical protein [Opitutus sp.]